MRTLHHAAWMMLAISLTACGEEEGQKEGEQTPTPARETLLGDVTAAPRFTTIADQRAGLNGPRDLDFHPGREGELWVVNRVDESVVIIFGATGDVQPTYEKRYDPARSHFMSHVSSIAFGAKTYKDDYTFGTCQESDNSASFVNFMGPTLWSGSLDIFAKVDEAGDGLGSHLDMLHHSPFCMGIAHEEENVYWVFDGHNGQIARYDFQEDHGPGFDDHSDGIIYFMAQPRVSRVENVPSHMKIDKVNRKIYVADSGNARVLWLDIDQREKLHDLPLQEAGTVVEVHGSTDWGALRVPADTLERPSGLTLHKGILYVGDNATGRIHAIGTGSDGYAEGEILATLETGIPPWQLMGLEVGPDERLYIVDFGNRILRLER